MAGDDLTGLGGFSVGKTWETTEVGDEEAKSQKSTDPIDTIQESEAIAMLYLYNAGLPKLELPDHDTNFDLGKIDFSQITGPNQQKKTVTFSTFQMNMQSKLSEITGELLDRWLESLQKQTEEIREYMNSPQFLSRLEVVSYDAAKEIQKKMQLEMQFKSGLAEGIQSYRKNEPKSAAPQVAFLAATLIMGVAFAGQFVNMAMQTQAAAPVAGLDPTLAIPQNAWGHFSGIVGSSTVATQAGYYSGALFASILNNAEATNIVQSFSGKGHTDRNLFANYAVKVLDLTKGPMLNYFLMGSVIDKMAGADKLSEKQKFEMADVMKITLLSTALAGLYYSQTKWIGPEFKQMLEGKMDLAGDSQEAVLIAQIQEIAGRFSLEKREALYTSITAYLSTAPDMEEMLNIKKAFDTVIQGIPHQEPKG